MRFLLVESEEEVYCGEPRIAFAKTLNLADLSRYQPRHCSYPPPRTARKFPLIASSSGPHDGGRTRQARHFGCGQGGAPANVQGDYIVPSNSSADEYGTDIRGQKYTVQPSGFWARINNFLAVDSKRSTGIPLNPQFRNPPPGGNDPSLYDDPTTVPAADLAENPYWKRDVRRQYPKLSVVKQPDVVALLTVGSAKSPKEDVLQIGDAGKKQLVQVKEEGDKGLSAFFEKRKEAGLSVLGPNGLPPLPASHHPKSKRYAMLQDQSYAGK